MGNIANWGLIAAVVGAVIGVLAVWMNMKWSSRKAWGTIGVVLIVLGVVSQVMTVPLLSNPIGESQGGIIKGLAVGDEGVSGAGTAGNTPQPQPSVTSDIVKTQPVTVTLSALNKETDAAAGGTHRYQLDSGGWLTIADAGTFSATPGQMLKVLFMNASTVNNYYSSLESFQIPSAATFNTNTLGGKLTQNGTLTSTLYNENSDAINGNGVNLTLGAGDERTIKFELQGQFQRGHPYGIVRVLEWNRTSIDFAKVLNFNGVDVVETNVPSADSPSNTGVDRKAYLLPSVVGSATLAGNIVINADDTVNPGIESDIVVRDYSLNYYVDEQDGGKIKGPSVSDENLALTSLNTLNSTIHTV